MMFPSKPSRFVDRRRLDELRTLLVQLPPLGDNLAHSAAAVAVLVGCSARAAAGWCALDARHVRAWWRRWGWALASRFGWNELVTLASALEAEDHNNHGPTQARRPVTTEAA